MPVAKSILISVLHVIGWEGGASFLDQSKSVLKQKQCSPVTFDTELKITSQFTYESFNYI